MAYDPGNVFARILRGARDLGAAIDAEDGRSDMRVRGH